MDALSWCIPTTSQFPLRGQVSSFGMAPVGQEQWWDLSGMIYSVEYVCTSVPTPCVQLLDSEYHSSGTADQLCYFLFRNTTGVTEEALKEFSMMFKWVARNTRQRKAWEIFLAYGWLLCAGSICGSFVVCPTLCWAAPFCARGQQPPARAAGSAKAFQLGIQLGGFWWGWGDF